jgi:hypothetical protein
MVYEKFKQEVARILGEKDTPVTWNEIKASSTKLKQKAPYHVYVQKLQGDIGLVRFKHEKKTVWALRQWFEDGRFRELLPEKARLTILSVNSSGYAIAANEYWELKRIYPLEGGLRRWDVIEADVEDYFPEVDKRPESMRLKEGGLKYVRSVEDVEAELKIAEKIAESGEFLHTDAWKGKTLGLTKPRFRCFYFYDKLFLFDCS